jgi:hypothetical protein
VDHASPAARMREGGGVTNPRGGRVSFFDFRHSIPPLCHAFGPRTVGRRATNPPYVTAGPSVGSTARLGYPPRAAGSTDADRLGPSSRSTKDTASRGSGGEGLDLCLPRLHRRHPAGPSSQAEMTLIEALLAHAVEPSERAQVDGPPGDPHPERPEPASRGSRATSSPGRPARVPRGAHGGSSSPRAGWTTCPPISRLAMLGPSTTELATPGRSSRHRRRLASSTATDSADAPRVNGAGVSTTRPRGPVVSSVDLPPGRGLREDREGAFR